MSTALQLHHLGEALLASLIRGLAERDQLGVPCRLHSACSLSSVLDGAGIRSPCSCSANVPLAPIPFRGQMTRFDGVHCVDVLCHDNDGHSVALEAKLGLDRLAPGEFSKRFLKPVEPSSHSQPRFGGSMIAILSDPQLGSSLRTTEPPTAVAQEWGLVIRRKVWKRWEVKQPALSHAHVFVFEDIVRDFGDATVFDRLVAELVGARFHEAWRLSQ